MRRPKAVLHIENLPLRTVELILRVLDVTARGGTLSVTALPEELTTSTAAKILGISRPTLMKMIREGRIPAHEVGTHHRLRTEDVFTELHERR
ncbi:MAG: helix-turn-helix domain-containing protein, partial [Propionibacteriaceae bacterium]|nr:helix-turn-helix domain-containing protein [Propionibacteriaceae bacterium]